MTNPQPITPPSRFWIVRKPDSSGTTVAKFDTPSPDGTTVVIPDTCVAYSVADRASLDAEPIDMGNLTASEKAILGRL